MPRVTMHRKQPAAEVDGAMVRQETPEWVSAMDAGEFAIRTAVSDLEPESLRTIAAAHGRRLLQLETLDAVTAEDVISAFAETFEFDEDYECDWDCVDDRLADFDVSPAAGLVLTWTGWESVAEEDDHVMAVAVDALKTAAQSWSDEGRPWTILVAGDGPSWELPWAGTGQPPWQVDEDDDFELDDLADEGLEDALDEALDADFDEVDLVRDDSRAGAADERDPGMVDTDLRAWA